MRASLITIFFLLLFSSKHRQTYLIIFCEKMGGRKSIVYSDYYSNESGPMKQTRIYLAQATHANSQNDNLLSIVNPNLSQFPCKCIGYLTWNNDMGTGFLVAPNLVLTVAHNVYDIKTMSQNSLIFHRSSQDRKGIIVVGRKWCKKYEDIQQFEFPQNDYALLKLAQPVILPKYIELGVGYRDLQQELLMIAFPANQKDSKKQQKILKGAPFYRINRFFMHYQFTTIPGNSGSPVLAQRCKGETKEYVAVALHKGSSNITDLQVIVNFDPNLNKKDNGKDGQKKIQKKINAGPYISTPMLKDILKWQAQFNGPQQKYIKYHLLEKSDKMTQLNQKIRQQQTFGGWDLTTSFSSDFQVQLNKIRMIENQNDYVQITGKHPLPKYYSSTSFKVLKYGGPYPIIFGITTNPLKYSRKSTGMEAGSIGYWSALLKLAEGSICVDGGDQVKLRYIKQLVIPQGEVLQMDVDRINNQIAFKNRAKLRNEMFFCLPQKFINQDIYVFVSMADKNSSIEIL